MQPGQESPASRRLGGNRVGALVVDDEGTRAEGAEVFERDGTSGRPAPRSARSARRRWVEAARFAEDARRAAVDESGSTSRVPGEPRRAHDVESETASARSDEVDLAGRHAMAPRGEGDRPWPISAPGPPFCSARKPVCMSWGSQQWPLNSSPSSSIEMELDQIGRVGVTVWSEDRDVLEACVDRCEAVAARFAAAGAG